MAENSEDRSREDLTEEASPHRIEEYRNKGMVAQSREISGLAALIATGLVAYTLSPKIGNELLDFMREVFRVDWASHLNLGSHQIAGNYLQKTLKIIVSIGFPICAAGFALGALGSIAQIGLLFTLEPLTPDLNRLNPIQGLSRIVSGKQAVEALRLILKMAVVLFVTYLLIKTEILKAPLYAGGDANFIIVNLGKTAKAIFLALIGVLSLFAAADFGFQWYEHQKNLKMTKQEAKQEHKEREGNPQIRARIRSIQREMARRRMMQAVKKADVVVTNPTHIAVALTYDKVNMSAPKVVAKGADLVAQKIKQIAGEAGIPMVENVPLARTLYKAVKVGHVIPRQLYQAVAEVLAFVYRLRRKDL